MRTALLILCSALLLTACVDISVNQKLYRDNTVDMKISFKGEPQVLSGFTNMKPHPAVADKFTYTDTGGSLSYAFARIPVGAHLFLLDESQDTGFFGIEEYTLTKKAGFPYYHYSYTLTPGKALPDDANDQTAAMLGSIKITYQVETFGTVTSTSGTQIDDHTVEFVINPASKTPNTIEFREFFLTAWFS